jgi:hypothetical protein
LNRAVTAAEPNQDDVVFPCEATRLRKIQCSTALARPRARRSAPPAGRTSP